MKWLLILGAAGIAVYLFANRKGKVIRRSVSTVATETAELKDYLGNIASDIKQQGLKYGERPEPVASRQRHN